MPRADGDAFLIITSRGLRAKERRFRAMTQLNERFIREQVRELMEDIAIGAVFVLQARAPERTGRLAESIEVVGRNRSVTRPSVRIGSDVRSDTGFRYLNVTRFGRRAVEAKGRAKLARSYAAEGRTGRGFQRRPFRAAKLRFEPGPPGTGFIYRRRVRAYWPARDWVGAAEADIRRMGDREFETVTEMIEKIIETGTTPRRVITRRTTRTGRLI